jgi:hypothetical protein
MKGHFIYGVIYVVRNIFTLFCVDVNYHWLDNNIVLVLEGKHET